MEATIMGLYRVEGFRVSCISGLSHLHFQTPKAPCTTAAGSRVLLTENLDNLSLTTISPKL